ncbi:MAG: hypothetical protein JNK64_32000 [Myxococcales bacterium]|nr:hypothetical protein [Myxococcales bacterium]
MADPSAPSAHRHWVTLEDQYDGDAYRLGPFPTLAAAIEFCDAHNGAQLKAATAPLDDAFVPKAVGVWSLATCATYAVGARLRAMLRDPSTIPRDAAATLQARHGARTEVDWRLDEVAAATLDRCWCAELRAGVAPAATEDQLEGYLRRHVRTDGRLPDTHPSGGSLELGRCAPCGGTVAHLMIEVDEYETIVHHYFTPISAAERAALDAATYEAWAADRPGIYSARTHARAYRRVEIGTARLEGWAATAPAQLHGWLFEAERGDSRFFVPDDGVVVVGRDPRCDVWVINDDVAATALLVDGYNARASVDQVSPTPLAINGVRGTATELQDGMRLRLAIDVEYRATPFAGTRLRHHALRADEVRRFAGALGRQLADLHAQGLIHGAITPDQVLVDGAGHPRLLIHRPARAGTAAPDGDPAHRAPELQAGGPLTAAADVYALGTLLVPALRDPATDLGLVAFVGQLMTHDPDARPAAWTLR